MTLVIAAIFIIISHHIISIICFVAFFVVVVFVVLVLPCVIFTIWFKEGLKSQMLHPQKEKQGYQNTLSFLISGELRGFSIECNMALWRFLGQAREASYSGQFGAGTVVGM